MEKTMSNPQNSQTHSEYMLQTLFYIGRLINEGDYSQVISLGLTQEQAQRIGTMSLEGLHELALSMRTHMLKIAFDAKILDTAFDIHQRRSQERQEALAMIKAGASFPVMSQLYGINKPEFVQLRRQLNLSAQDIGRYELPDMATQRLIWSTWLLNEVLDDKQRLLAVHQATHVKIRAIWALLNEWKSTGLTPEPIPPNETTTLRKVELKESGNFQRQQH
jgi:Protein of unknown function (DUF2857)